MEFGPIDLYNGENADVLILSGDTIPVAFLDPNKDTSQARMLRDQFDAFIDNITNEFPKVIMIAGNHEHYHYDFEKTIPMLKRYLGFFDNVHVLDKQAMEIGDIVFLGGTLWTDMNKEDPVTMTSIRWMMNDFQLVNNGDHTFAPADAVADHKAMLNFLDDNITPNKTYVVVGHHAPSKQSTKPRYQNDDITNGGYSSSLEEFILDHPNIKLWTHGHTHHSFDYMIGETRVVCNPRGYIGHEHQADIFELQYIEV